MVYTVAHLNEVTSPCIVGGGGGVISNLDETMDRNCDNFVKWLISPIDISKCTGCYTPTHPFWLLVKLRYCFGRTRIFLYQFFKPRVGRKFPDEGSFGGFEYFFRFWEPGDAPKVEGLHWIRIERYNIEGIFRSPGCGICLGLSQLT